MRSLIAAFLLVPLLAAPCFCAQRSRTGVQRGLPAPGDTATAIRDVSDKAQDFWNQARQQHDTSVLNLYMNMGAFAGQALALNDIAANLDQRGYRNDNELRNGAQRLVSLAMEIDRELTRSNLLDSWRLVQQNLLRLSEIYDLGYNAPGLGRRQWRTYGGGPQGSGAYQGAGRFLWRGRVDGSDQILLRGSQVSIKHLQYNPIRDSSYDLPQPFPARTVDLRLNKLRGRGRVEIVGQPAAWNNYTATILVDDPDAGDDYYEFELRW